MNWTAGLVTLGGITTTVPAQYDTDVNWNGFLCPWLDPHAVEVVLASLRRAYAAATDDTAPTHEWDGDVLVLTEHDGDGNGYTTRMEPDADGLYPLGAYGWVWQWVDGVDL